MGWWMLLLVFRELMYSKDEFEDLVFADEKT
jgi:hypothetical protein